MATLSNPVYYKAGDNASDILVGVASKNNRNVRYTLTMGKAESADHIEFTITESSVSSIVWGDGSDHREINDKISLYFAISTDPNEYANAGINQVSKALGKVTMSEIRGYWVEDNVVFKATGNGAYNLLPGQTYYLWIFPGYTTASGGNGEWGYFVWGKSLTTTVSLSGAAGVVQIDTGSAILKAIPYIDDGTEFLRTIPYNEDGTIFSLVT